MSALQDRVVFAFQQVSMQHLKRYLVIIFPFLSLSFQAAVI